MMAKPIRALELHYPMIQFLIIQAIARKREDNQEALVENSHIWRRNSRTSLNHEKNTKNKTQWMTTDIWSIPNRLNIFYYSEFAA